MARAPGDAAVERLLALKGDFVRFVRARTGSDAEAEDLLQAAYVKAAEKAGAIREDESTVAWFYRLLRNAIVDARRDRRRAEALAGQARRLEETLEDAIKRGTSPSIGEVSALYECIDPTGS